MVDFREGRWGWLSLEVLEENSRCREKIINIRAYYDSELTQQDEVLSRTREEIFEPFARFVTDCVKAIQRGNKLLFFGNGGSVSDAQHIVTEFTVRFKNDRPAIAAVALTTDTSALTAIGKDFGFQYVFSRQVEALCVQGDIAIGISTSGNSENVIRGLKAAKQIGCGSFATTLKSIDIG